MRILVFEFATSGGIGGTGTDEEQSLLAALWNEGELMRRLVTQDLLAAGHRVESLLAPHHPDSIATRPVHRDAHTRTDVPVRRGFMSGMDRLDDALRRVDATLLIAPECNGLLARLADAVHARSGRLLSPDPSFIRLAGDKQQMADWLADRNVPVPTGRLIEPGDLINLSVPPPWVVKPIDGAGSMEVSRLDQSMAERAQAQLRLEAFCPGTPASVAVLGGPSGWIVLEPCLQRLRDDRHFEYLGGRLPLSPDLSRRARQLARQVVQCLPDTQGYVGLDMVLGPSHDGNLDYVIEVNPRLTSSYAGLRQAAQGNLAAWMVDVANGKPVDVNFSTQQIDFSLDGSDGSVPYDSSSSHLSLSSPLTEKESLP